MKPVQRHHFPTAVLNTALLLVALWSSLKALEYVSIPLYVVASNGRPLCSAILEFFIQGHVPTQPRMVGLALILFGAAVTTLSDRTTELNGFLFAFLNTLLIGVLGVYENVIMSNTKKEQTALGLNLYRMTLSLPMLFVMMLFTSEVSNLRTFEWDSRTIILLGASGTFCLFLGVVMFTLQGVTSATSIQVANTLFKFVTTILSLFTHPGNGPNFVGWMGYSVCTMGFALYSFDLSPLYDRFIPGSMSKMYHRVNDKELTEI
jgi:drug/metabolite transporter (DMT)-like permease